MRGRSPCVPWQGACELGHLEIAPEGAFGHVDGDGEAGGTIEETAPDTITAHESPCRVAERRRCAAALARREALTQARVVIVCAGMEGALPSVVGGLVGVPVIAVPTSIGYGASYEGIAALLGMLNSCASNVSVVNIDNGFGAGYVASIINRLE